MPDDPIFPQDHQHAKRATTSVYVRPEGRIYAMDDKGRVKLDESLQRRKAILGPDTLDAVDQLFSDLYVESPWLREPLEYLWKSAKSAINGGYPGLRFEPVFLVGPPGCGKTFVAEMLARLSGLPSARLDFSSLSSGFNIAGQEHGWRGGDAGEPVHMIGRSNAVNGIFVCDEIEKSRAGSDRGTAMDALLPLLQRDTARKFRCPFLKADVDLSHLNWILLANDLTGVPAPLLDRCKVFHVGYPTGKDLRALVTRKIGDLVEDTSVIDQVCRKLEAGKFTLRGLDRLRDNFEYLQSRGKFN